MSRKILKQQFYNRRTTVVAGNLLGKFLVQRLGRKAVAYMITETEAYDGFKDRGSHAHRGKTKRNWPMFGPPGHWYVYFTYGMYWMLNIVTRERGYPAAVLIRGIQGTSGPGRLTKKLKIGGSFSGKPAAKATGLWIEDRGVKIPPSKIRRGPRVGIHYAGPYWTKRHWRFWLEPLKLR